MRDPIAIIQARMGSTRFPGKVMAEVGGKPILRHVYDRVMAAEGVSFAMVAADYESEQVHWYCWENGIPVFIASSDTIGVFARVQGAAAGCIGTDDYFLRVCADCPLIDPVSFMPLTEIARMADNHQLPESPDYIAYRRSSDGMPAIRTGQGLPELVRWSALDDRAIEAREHVTAGLYEMPGQCIWLDHPCDESNTVDTPEDLERLRPKIEASQIHQYERSSLS